MKSSFKPTPGTMIIWKENSMIDLYVSVTQLDAGVTYFVRIFRTFDNKNPTLFSGTVANECLKLIESRASKIVQC